MEYLFGPYTASDDGGLSQTFVVRTYQDPDGPAVCELFYNGLLTEQIDLLESTDDLDDIPGHYLLKDGNHFYVAEANGVIGTIAVQLDLEGVAHVRRLLVSPEWRQSNVAYDLVKTAITHASDYGAVKVVIHTPANETRVLEALGELGFSFSKIQTVRGRQLREFYLDLQCQLPNENHIGAAQCGVV